MTRPILTNKQDIVRGRFAVPQCIGGNQKTLINAVDECRSKINDNFQTKTVSCGFGSALVDVRAFSIAACPMWVHNGVNAPRQFIRL